VNVILLAWRAIDQVHYQTDEQRYQRNENVLSEHVDRSGSDSIRVPAERKRWDSGSI